MFFWFLFCCVLILPVIMLIAGRLMWRHPPKEINHLIGYRTPRSMKNQDTWNFAHICCGRLWWTAGWGVLVLSALLFLPFRGMSDTAVGIASIVFLCAQLAVLFVSIAQTERALRRTFDENGIRK